MKPKLIKKKNVYYIQYEGHDGKIHHKTCSNCSTLKQAQRCLNLFMAKNNVYLIKNIAADMFIPGSEHLSRMKQYGRTYAPETIYQKRYHIQYMIKYFGDRDIRYLSVKEIQNFLLADNHSGSYKNNFLDTIKLIYQETVWKCPAPVPEPKFQRFARNSKKADVLTSQELNLFFNPNIWDNEQAYVAYQIIYNCGLRISELRALKVKNFLFNEKVLLIDGFCKTDGTRTNYNKKGSDENRKLRLAPLSDKLISIVINYILKYSLNSNDYLISREDGRPYRKEYLENIFKRIIDKANIKRENRKLVPHSLRFTYVTQMRSRCEADQVRKIVGHTSMQMTDYYTRFLLENEINSLSNTFTAVNQI